MDLILTNSERPIQKTGNQHPVHRIRECSYFKIKDRQGTVSLHVESANQTTVPDLLADSASLVGPRPTGELCMIDPVEFASRDCVGRLHMKVHQLSPNPKLPWTVKSFKIKCQTIHSTPSSWVIFSIPYYISGELIYYFCASLVRPATVPTLPGVVPDYDPLEKQLLASIERELEMNMV